MVHRFSVDLSLIRDRMPVHSREKKESNHEEMEVDFGEQEGSSSEDEDTESSSVSEDGESSGAHHTFYLSI